MDHVVQALFAVSEDPHHLPLVEGLFLSGDDPSLHHIHHGVCKHFSMHAQVMLVHQGCGGGIWNPPNSELNSVPVIDQGGDVPADFHVHLAWLGIRKLGNLCVHLHNAVHIPDVYLCVTKHPGKIGIDLQDDQVGTLQHLLFVDQTQGNTEIAMVVHGGRLPDEHIGPVSLHPAPRAVVEIGRERAEQAQLVGRPVGSHKKDAVQGEVLFVGRVVHKGVLVDTHTAHHSQISHLRGDGVELTQQGLRIHPTLGCADHIPGLDVGQGFLRCHFFIVILCPVFAVQHHALLHLICRRVSRINCSRCSRS